MIQIEVPEDWEVKPGDELFVQVYWRAHDVRSKQIVEVEEVKATRHPTKVNDDVTGHYIKKQLICRRIGSPHEI